jgi:hypothetical protein
MQGAKSGKTKGKLHSELSTCKFSVELGMTDEITILGNVDEPFSGIGDSGAWVIEDDGRNGFVIGVLHGGSSTEVTSVSYIMPMDHLLEDISARLGVELAVERAEKQALE